MTKRRRSTRAPKPVEKSDEVLEEADDGNQDPTSEEAAEMSPEQDVEGETNDDVTETAKEPDADTAEKLPDSDKKEQPPTKDEVAVSEPGTTTEAAAVESSKIVDDNSSDKSVDKPDVVAAVSTEKSEENAIANTASDGKEQQKDSSDCSKETAQVDKSGPAGENTQQVDKPPEIDLTISDDEDEPMEVESTSTKPLSSTIDLSTAPDSPDVSVIQTPSTQSAGGVGDNVKKDDVQMDGGDSPEIEYAVLSEEREKTPEEEAAEKAKAEAEEAAAKVKAEEEAAAARAKAEAEEAAAKAKAEKEAAAAKLKAEQEAAAAKAKAERRKLLQEMAEAKINYDDDEESIPIDPEFDHEDDEEPSESEGFKRYWRTVTDSPQDFTAWTYLLQLVEQEGKLRLARRAYNNFFKRYPLCYGYWKKFSEVERKKGNMLRARKILERGVRAIPLSVDLWVHVIDFYIKHYTAEDGGKDKVRTIFERAVRAAGEEFRSEKLWNKYIQWEIENKRMIAVIGLYDRVLQTETQHYSIFFNDFSDLVNAHSPSELMSFTDFEQVLQQARDTLASDAAKKPIEKAAEKKPADGEKTDEKEDEDEEMDDAPPGVEDHEKPPNEEELKHIRVQMIKERKKLFDVTEQAVTKVWAFEEGIKRPYFHVKQLERAQLKNWREYLDSEIARGEHNRIVLLFERCLIACALYEDFWMKFAKYMITHDAEKARGIYKRACDIHLPKKANIHIQWAAFEELQGNSEEASKILEQLDNSVPGMAMIKMRRVAVSRRAGDLQTAESLLRTFVAAAAKDKEELFYSRKLAWFLFKMTDKTDEARKLLRDLIPKYRSESKLYNDLVEMEFHSAGVHLDELEEQQAVDAFDLALACDKLSDEQKFSFSQKKLEFLEDFGRDVKRLQKTYDEHQKLVKNQKKQRAQDVSETSSQPPAKKSKNEPAVSVPVIPPPVSVTPVVANGNRYGGATATTPAGGYPAGMHHHPPQPHPHHPHPVPNPAFGAAGGDPHHQQYYQQQNYWNFQQQKANEQAHYGYNQQWNQYYGQR